MQTIISLAVKPLFPNARTYLDTQLGSHCHETKIEQLVKIRSQKKPILCAIWTLFRKRFYVRSLKYRQGMFARNGALSLVCLSYEYTEGSLTQSRPC